MNTYKLSNISVNDFRDFLASVGCQKTKTEGGHERWVKTGLTRPIILQTHIKEQRKTEQSPTKKEEYLTSFLSGFVHTLFPHL